MTHIATVNVNGVRAAFRKGMADWLASTDAEVVALQEVRASTADLTALVGDEWHVAHDEASAKGRAGVALLSRFPILETRTALGPDDFDSAGRWLECDLDVHGTPLTAISAYVHSGEVDTPKQVEKFKMLDAMIERLPQLRDGLALLMGDLNVGHTELDIKNWKGNVKRAGFLPEERAYFDRFFGDIGWVDVGRRSAGDVPGPYTWWSWRGKAFDTDAGWRIDYHAATPQLAERVVDYRVEKAPSYDTRWSDHTPVIAGYEL